MAGICQSVATRVASLASVLGVREEACMSGGVAQNGGVRNAMAKRALAWKSTTTSGHRNWELSARQFTHTERAARNEDRSQQKAYRVPLRRTRAVTPEPDRRRK
ncbi:MAG: hypothetical protein ACLUD2_21835 [Clostridium sp.]